MILKQRLVVVPQGLVESGDASYVINLENGSASYTADVKVGMLFITKTFNLAGPFKIDDPKIFISSNVKVGSKIRFGPFHMEITSISDRHQATASVEIIDENMNEAGSAVFDCSNQYVSLVYAKVTGTVYSQPITLQIQPA